MTNRWVLVLLVGGLGFAAGCGDGGDGDVDGGPVDKSRGAEEEPDQGDTCELLGDDELGEVFIDEVPEPSGTSFGAGFSECAWGADDDAAQVLVSVLPADDFRSDYLEQLNVTTPVPDLGDEAVSFPGFVGIGRGSAGGDSVGFLVGDEAAIVAVRMGDDTAAAAAAAVELAGSVEAGL